MGQGKLMLYSLVLQPPHLFKHYHQAIWPVILLQSLAIKFTTCISACGTCALHPPCTFNEGLTTTLLGLEAETFAGAATSEIVSASPWYKRPSSPDKPITFFLTLSTLFNPTRCCPSFTNLSCFVFRCCALYAPRGVSPAFVPRQQPTLVMLADKHTRNVCLLSAPSNHAARGVFAQDALARTPLGSTMMKPYLSVNGHQDPKQADGNNSRRLALSPQVLICPPPLLGHHLMVTSLLDLSQVIIWLMKDGNGKRTFELGPIVTNGIQTPKTKPPRQDSPIPSLPREQMPRQPTPGPSGIQWSEELFREPSRVKEPPIPGPSPSSQPSEDNMTREPEPEGAPKQSTEEPFGSHHFSFFTPINFYSPFL
ncbi:hypothetical protein O181_093261 [Austropuccinia psidii MF-1]|uniref:Uncharacterized protein n=1 Tax=Austropuccinia psidii MF-1 TaxID=1389203 RepID=A0A9Q3J151_9BASI|nr:hypothetical protein [Austropuccinia psidii MF-1]